MEDFEGLAESDQSEEIEISDQEENRVYNFEDDDISFVEDERNILDEFETNPQLNEYLTEWRDEIYRKNTVLRLNDDCLNKVFSFLPINDLCALRETCSDFRRVSEDSFDRRFKNCRLKRFVHNSHSSSLQLSDGKRLLRNFGQFIISLTIVQTEFESGEYILNLLPAIDRYCIGIRDLTMSCSGHKESLDVSQYDGLRCKLNRLTIGNFINPGNAKERDIFIPKLTLGNYPKLTHLKIAGFSSLPIVDEIRCELLESLSLQGCVIKSSDSLRNMIVDNSKLKEMKITSCLGRRVTLPQLQSLESLCIQDAFCSTTQKYEIVELTGIDISSCRLKKLVINTKFVPSIDSPVGISHIVSCLITQNFIEHLHFHSIHSIRFDHDLINHLCALKTLKVLHFTKAPVLNDEAIEKLSLELPNLEIFGYEGRLNFTGIERFVKHSKSVKRIIFLNRRIRSFTKEMFFSLVTARLQNEQRPGTLLFYLHKRCFEDWSTSGKGTHLEEKHADDIKILKFTQDLCSVYFFSE